MTNVILTVLILARGMMPRELALRLSWSSSSMAVPALPPARLIPRKVKRKKKQLIVGSNDDVMIDEMGDQRSSHRLGWKKEILKKCPFHIRAACYKCSWHYYRVLHYLRPWGSLMMGRRVDPTLVSLFQSSSPFFFFFWDYYYQVCNYYIHVKYK